QLLAGALELAVEPLPELHQRGRVEFLDEVVVRRPVLGADQILGDLAPQAAQWDPLIAGDGLDPRSGRNRHGRGRLHLRHGLVLRRLHEGEKVGLEYAALRTRADRKSTRLNSSHVKISYAVFCLKK